MHVICIDDSGQSGCPRTGLGTLRSLGAVVMHEDHIAGYVNALESLKAELGIPAAEEIKWNPGKGSHLASADGTVIRELRRRMLTAAAEHEVRTVVVIIDHSAAYRNASQAQVGKHLLDWLFERIVMLLGPHDRGIAIADKPGGGAAQERTWLAQALALSRSGTEYVQPGGLILPIVTAPSDHFPLLQLADLVTAATTAAISGRPHGLALAPLLAPLMHRNVHGNAGGAGLVLFPNGHNLLHWVFGEDTYSRPSWNAGVSLPCSEWPYHVDDGMPTAGHAL